MKSADRWCGVMLLLRRAVAAQVVLLAFVFLFSAVLKWLAVGVVPLFLLLGGIAIASLLCLVATFITAAMIDGAGYALRHLLLAVALLPVLLLGVLLVPLLVRSDGLKWGRLTHAES